MGSPLAPCGTPSAGKRHRRRGEPLDDACRAALAEHRALYKALPKHRWVPIAPVRDHLVGLKSLGWAPLTIGRATGVPVSTVKSYLLDGRTEARVDIADALLALRAAPSPSNRCGPVAAMACTRRVQALKVVGWTQQEMIRAGMTHSDVSLATQPHPSAIPSTCERVARVYAHLLPLTPRGRHNTRIERWWLPPGAWEDIDLGIIDPDWKTPDIPRSSKTPEPLDPVKCGTPAQERAHRRRGETCEACRIASNRDSADRKRRRAA